MTYESGDGHVGCGLSSIEVLIALYFNVMDIGKDRFILSKGHAVAALYATLIERGIAPASIADEYCRNGSIIASHASRAVHPAIEVSSGSGGHGLPIGIGMALANRYNKNYGSRIFIFAGDGELAEGSMWEGIAFAGHHQLENLTLIIDANGFQSEGRTEDILDLRPMGDKFRAFRWTSDTLDGHNINWLAEVLGKRTGKPHAVIANTVKGKGVSFMEGKYDWHHIAPTKEQYELALKELDE